jgi:hypothetical protein
MNRWHRFPPKNQFNSIADFIANFNSCWYTAVGAITVPQQGFQCSPYASKRGMTEDAICAESFSINQR